MMMREKNGKRGFVLITMTVSAIALIGALGLAVDMGHVFITKNETQAFVDASALAAALQLNGQDTGITNAKAAVTTMKSNDKWNFGATAVVSPIVEFTTSAPGAAANAACTGGWTTNPPSPPSAYNCVRVKASISVPMYFIPVVLTTPAYNMTVNSQAVAGQIDLTTIGTGLAPYSGISTNPAGPNFGLTVGTVYTIQWPPAQGSTCTGAVKNCFGQDPCPGDLVPASGSGSNAYAVWTNWSNSTSGYWGATSNSLLESYILGGAQLQSVSVGTNLEPSLTSGQKNAEGGWLDWKVNHDTDSVDNDWPSYKAALDSGAANGQRLMNVPVLQPLVLNTNTNVLGYGQYLLETNAKVLGNGNVQASNFYTQLNGNSSWCAIYAGPIDIGSTTPGVGGTTGAAMVQLIQ
jgi:Flp pilus assembly protein TadG